MSIQANSQFPAGHRMEDGNDHKNERERERERGKAEVSDDNSYFIKVSDYSNFGC